jgi:hypothetical protein
LRPLDAIQVVYREGVAVGHFKARSALAGDLGVLGA